MNCQISVLRVEPQRFSLFVFIPVGVSKNSSLLFVLELKPNFFVVAPPRNSQTKVDLGVFSSIWSRHCNKVKLIAHENFYTLTVSLEVSRNALPNKAIIRLLFLNTYSLPLEGTRKLTKAEKKW